MAVWRWKLVKDYFAHRRRASILFLVFLGALTILLHLQEPELPSEYKRLQTLLARSKRAPKMCQVPQLDPWDPSILAYYAKPDPLQCRQFQEAATFVEPATNTLMLSAKLQKSIDAGDEICRFRHFRHNDGVDDVSAQFDEWRELKRPTKLTREFVEVECSRSSTFLVTSYRYHWSNVIKQEVNVAQKKIKLEAPDRPSVIMIGLDSMSRGNFVRQLPKTHKHLLNSGFVEMKGHVKVMDNTYGNWLAIMTGKTSTITREFQNELPDEWNLWFDDWDLIWKHFANQSYATLFAEDRPDIGTFNYFGYLNGFRKAPVDHYFRTYWLACYWSLAFRRSTTGCYDANPLHQLQLGYLEDFLEKYEEKRKFAWWWTQDLSHDHLNMIGVMDEDLKGVLERNRDLLQNSVVIIFSDHGHRYASIRATVVGRLEARLPFLAIRLPDAMRKKYPFLAKNLQKNAQKMTTQYDLHETLLHLASGAFDPVKDGRAPEAGVRAHSLLRNVDPLRTCFQARIPEDYCPCYEEMEIGHMDAQKPAQVLMEYVNALLLQNDARKAVENGEGKNGTKDFYTCAPLKLKKIQFASVKLPPQKLVQDPQVKNNVASSGIDVSYRVALECESPSGAHIEGVILRSFDTDEWKATGEIERNNKYGNTSHCVADRVLKKLCHCLPTTP